MELVAERAMVVLCGSGGGKMKALLIKVEFCDAFVWSLNTNEVREVAAMANF